MPEQTLEVPRLQAGRAGRRSSPSSRGTRPSPAEVAYRLRWWLAAAALLVIALIVVLAGGARPGYDPYGWLVWGKLSVHLKLDTNGAPSWKPLPFLFTVPYALVGHYALWLWMVTSVAISLSGFVFAWRIAFKLTNAEPARRYAAYLAGLFAAVLVLLLHDPLGYTYTHYLLSAESDTMIVALCLAAVDLHLSGRHRWAFWLWWLAALGRPEVWPFWVLAGVWLWRAAPEYRRWLIASAALLVFLWFGIPGLTSKSFLTAGNIAENSPRAIHGNKVTGTVHRFFQLESTPVWVAAAITVALAALRRQRAILLVTAGALLWLVIEIAFALHGFPAVPRYMFESGAVIAVLAGVFAGRVALAAPRLTGWGAALVLVVFAVSLFPAAHDQLRQERVDLKHEHARTAQIDHLATVVRRLGTGRMLACGQPNIPIGYQSQLAWYMGVKTGILYVSQAAEQVHPHPLVNLYPTRHQGWKVFTSHVDAAAASRCQGLNRVFKF